jgi:hypothetical protein
MARALRIQRPGAVYHVVAKAISRMRRGAGDFHA